MIAGNSKTQLVNVEGCAQWKTHDNDSLRGYVAYAREFTSKSCLHMIGIISPDRLYLSY
jgi:hypothetical protein